MKKCVAAIFIFALGMRLPGGELVVASPGRLLIGESILFRFAPGGEMNGSYRWDFGDGHSESKPGLENRHLYSQPGFYRVTCTFEGLSAGPVCGEVTVQVHDNRQLRAAPTPARVGGAVQFMASHFKGSDLRWSFGDGKVESGGQVICHAYAAPGNYQVQVWEAAAGPESAVMASLAVLPDVRQVSLSAPPDIFAGAEVVFEGRNFAATDLKWDFGDGVVEHGGARQPHRFQRPGSYLVNVVEADSDNLPVEKRIHVLNDDRGLVLKTNVVYADSEFEIEAQNFRGSLVSWDFGDGPVQTGQRRIKHRYDRTGQFRVRAVDFAGRDGKFVETFIQVEADTRLILLPVEIIAGEEVAMQLQNAGPGSLIWKFSDGESRSGPELRGKSFRSPGPHKISVVDATGNYPPLEKTVHVVPDTRSLKSSAGFILPREVVSFTAANFRGPGVRWDFGDGTIRENGQQNETHVYAEIGRYRVKAVDFSGRSSKVFQVDVVVADMTPGFELTAVELLFDNGKHYRIIAQGGPAPAYRLRVKARGRGVLSGQFMLDNMSIGLFQLAIQENQVAVLPKAQLTALPVADAGLHELTLKFSNYSSTLKMPVIKYFVTTAGIVRIVSPAIDARVPGRERIGLHWSIEWKNPLFEIAISDVPLQFLDDRRIQWLPVADADSFLFDPGPYKPGAWIYWQVRLLNENRQVQTTSEIASFQLGE